MVRRAPKTEIKHNLGWSRVPRRWGYQSELRIPAFPNRTKAWCSIQPIHSRAVCICQLVCAPPWVTQPTAEGAAARGDIAGFAVAEQALEPSELHGLWVLPGAFALMAFLPVTEITCQAEANNEPQVRFSLVGCPGCLSQSLGVTQL